MNSTFAAKVELIPQLFLTLKDSAPFIEKGVAWQNGKPGIYAFFDDEQPVHVGRTRHLGRRLKQHTRLAHNAASFAFKRARRTLAKAATYQPAGSRTALMRDADFVAEFRSHVERVKLMQVRFVEVEDPVLQYLLELYASIEWRLALDEFDTH